MSKSYFPALCALVLTGCAAAVVSPAGQHPIEKTSCRFNSDLLLSWSEFGSVGSYAPAPYIASYSGCGKEMHFVAAEHTNAPDSRTFALIGDIISEEENIGFLLVEGLPVSYGTSNPKVLTFAQAQKGTAGDNEAFFAIRRAADLEIPFQGAEPSDKDVLAAAESLGLSSTDVVGFYILRQIEQSVRSGQISSHDDPRLIEVIEQILNQVSKETERPISEFSKVSSLSGFKTWYKSLTDLDFDTAYRPDDVYPTGQTSNRPSNSLSDKISDIRDRTIIVEIEKALDAQSSVVVVFGASHYDIQKPVFDEAFGTATYKF